MNYVEPIRDLNKLNDMCDYLKVNNPRNYVMVMLGLYSGLRISDILAFKNRDIYKKNSITLREKKTDKQRIIPIHPELIKAVNIYCINKDPDDYLIKSREDYNRPITRDMALKIMKQLGDQFSISNMGCHSLRKTFGYHYYKRTGDIESLRKIYGHGHFLTTIRYIGWEQENINKAIMDIKY